MSVVAVIADNLDLLSISDDIQDAKVYLLSSYESTLDIISVARLVEENWGEYRAEYLSWLDSFCHHPFNGYSLKERFSDKEGYSFYWSSIINEKSIYKSPWISELFRVIALKSLLLSDCVERIILVGTDLRFQQSLRALARSLDIQFEHRPVASKKAIKHISQFRFNKKNLSKVLPKQVKAILYLMIVFYRNRRLLISFSRYKRRKMSGKRVLIVSKFPNIDIKKAQKGIFYSFFWGKLHDLMEKKNIIVDWVFLYFNNSSVTFPDSIKLIKGFYHSNQSYSLLFECLRFSDFFRVLLGYFNQRRTFKKFKKEASSFLSSPENEMYHSFLKSNLEESFAGTHAVESILFNILFKSLYSNNDYSSCFFMAEGQSWERPCCFYGNKLGERSTFGVLTSTIRSFDLRYASFSEKYFSEEKSHLPAQLTVFGDDLAANLKSMCISDELMYPVEALRYLTLNDAAIKKKINKTEDGLVFIILTCDVLDIVIHQCQFMLKYIKCYGDKEIKLIIKPHPLGNIPHAIFHDHFSGYNYEIINLPMSDLDVDLIDFALLDSSSSAAVECIYRRIPFCLLRYPRGINLSSLVRYQNLFVNTTTEMNFLVASRELFFDFLYNNDNDGFNFFFLDEKLLRWGSLLSSFVDETEEVK